MSEEIPNYNERFTQMADGAFSQIENHIGSDLYQANVEHAKTMNAALREHHDWSTKKHAYMGALLSFFFFILAFAAIPVMVMLWKVALAL